MFHPVSRTPALALNDSTVAQLPVTVRPPRYRRDRLTPAVVHIGVGSFHRAHEAAYLDDLARLGETNWGLTGVGLHSPEMGEVLGRQDSLYLMVERHERHDRARVVGAMIGYLFAPDDPEAVLTTLADARTRVVTLTITGPGYCIGPHTGEFNIDDEITGDLLEAAAPTTVFGYLVEALDRRRRLGIAPFTIMSCDNMPNNGVAARTAVVSFAALRDPELADWIDAHVAFPSSMVDRITPRTTPEDRDDVAGAFGVADGWPVITEPYRQWIVENQFCNGRPPLELVGVRFVDDVAPYQTMKTRLLNAGHCALGMLGTLAGHATTVEALSDHVLYEYLRTLMASEIAPLLPDVPGVDLDDYQHAILGRLLNPRMDDQLSRLTRHGTSKVSQYLVPSIAEAIEHGGPHDLLVMAVAGWMVLEADRQDIQPRALLAEDEVFGPLSGDDRFAARVCRTARALQDHGPRRVIEKGLDTMRGAA